MPTHLGLRPFTLYAPWLIKEIVVSNIQVTQIIIDPEMPIKRNLVEVTANQKTALGRVHLGQFDHADARNRVGQSRWQQDPRPLLSFEGAEEIHVGRNE